MNQSAQRGSPTQCLQWIARGHAGFDQLGHYRSLIVLASALPSELPAAPSEGWISDSPGGQGLRDSICHLAGGSRWRARSRQGPSSGHRRRDPPPQHPLAVPGRHVGEVCHPQPVAAGGETESVQAVKHHASQLLCELDAQRMAKAWPRSARRQHCYLAAWEVW